MNKKAFTLAETLITLTILGIVAAITVPSLINKQIESANRTKLKKAMTNYEKALNQMVIDNDLKTNNSIITFGEEKTTDNKPCGSTRAYFKTIEDGINNCRFKTADRIWWDISDIEHPLIILKDDKKNENINELKELAKNNDKNVFSMVGYIDDKGILRINDLGVATGDNKTILTKLYGFINSNNSLETANTCDYLCQIKKITDECPANCEDTNSCSSCKVCGEDINIYLDNGCAYYNNNKEYIGYLSEGGFWHTEMQCTNSATGKNCIRYGGCLNNICEDIYEIEYDSNNNPIKYTNKDSCNDDGKTNCLHISTIEGNYLTICDGNQNCTKGAGLQNVNLNDYGLGDIPFSNKEFGLAFIVPTGDKDLDTLNNNEVPQNYTAYLQKDGYIAHNSSFVDTSFEKHEEQNGGYNNIIKVENGQPVLLGEYNTENGTTIEADMKTGVVTIYQNCTGYKTGCDAQTQTTTVDALFNQ